MTDPTESLIALILILLLLLIGLVNRERRKRDESRRAGEMFQQAKTAYETTLELLKMSPGNAELRQKALLLGREYARIVREDGKETIFDELALLNDINAVTANAAVTDSKTGVKSLLERLSELKEMKELGLISEDEYAMKRSAILNDI